MISIQTNVASLFAQDNLRVNSNFQSRTIQQLSSGYRINSSADDAAGLAVANQFRSNVAQLTQGVLNANNGISTLQIADGGMSNISAMLDRLQILATESASQTFTGDRNTLNNEFQTVLGEIDRQAQSIGLNSGGQFAKTLAVFIGGGNSRTGGLDTANGTITMDLSNSAVDTAALGLKGTQVVATQGTDYIAALADNTNKNSESQSGYTTFYFSGAGFSDGSKMKVSVNLANANNLETLVTAINTAITSAGTGSGAATSAFANAGIVASVHTNVNGSKSLAFTSANAAFQVEAGDRMSNAFLGNQTNNTGTATSQTVTGAATVAGAGFTATNVVVRLTGAGLTNPVDIDLSASGVTTTQQAIDYISAQVTANAALQAAGVTVNDPAVGGQLTFTSARGEKLGVQVTGDTAGQLGFGGFLSNAGAVDYTTLTGSAYSRAGALGTAALEVSVNGAGSNGNSVSVDLSAGDATAATATGDATGPAFSPLALTVQIAGGGTTTISITGPTALQAAADINAAGAGITASVTSDGYLKIVDDNVNEQVVIGGAAATDFGVDGTYNGDATTAAAVTGDTTGPAFVPRNLTIALDGGGASTISITGATALQAAADINAANAGVTASVTSDGYLKIAANSAGGHTMVIGGAAGDDFGVAGTYTGNARSGQSVADALNSQFNSNTTLASAGMKASWNSGTNQLTVSSDNSTYFRLNAGGTTATTGSIGFGTTGTANYTGPTATNAANYVADAQGTTQTGALAFAPLTYGGESQAVTVSAKDSTGALQSTTITLKNVGGSSASRTGRSVDEAINYINQQLQSSNNAVLQKIVAVKEDVSGTPKINFISSLTGFSVSFGASSSGNGFGAAGTTVSAATSGTGGSLAVDTQAGAAQAVSSISSAITLLGAAQGALGQSQNQLNYAVNLAQSQIANFSAAESRIRDADVAADASNLSKAQVLQQATIAAMAQANTAPQAVLKLLG